MKQFDPFSRATGEPPGLLARILAFVVTVALVGVALMFSVFLFAFIVTVGVAAWAYLWWKTRDLRRNLHERPRDGLVIEGEVIREVREEDRREP